MTRVVYLHGFASSPESGKARFFAAKLAELGVEVHVPALEAGDFRHLTVTGQLEAIDRAVAGRPAQLIGSSLGGYLAALYAARHPEIERLVLMAPAFQFHRRLSERYTPEELAAWRRDGSVAVFHYGRERNELLGYQFLEDAARFEPEPEFAQPALIFHGVNDPVVPAAVSEAYAARRPNVILHLLGSGHELTDVVDSMWSIARPFLGSM
jgi:hypothetical protein